MSITLTARAATEIKRMMDAEKLPEGTAVRLTVVGGGCSGFSYRMAFDRTTNDDDQVLASEDVKVVVDGKSYLYLNGTEVDFQDGLTGRGFVFKNPNSTGQCGCGDSFSI